MILKGHVLSAEAYAVRLLAALSGAALRTEAVVLAPDAGPPPPRLVDGEAVAEGFAPALLHLARSRPGWFPDAPEARREVERWVAFAAGDLAAVLRLRDARLFAAPLDPADPARARSAYDRLDDALALSRLDGRRFLLGDGPTLADVACFPAAALADDAGLPPRRYPDIGRFVRAMGGWPGFVGMPGVVSAPPGAG